MPTGPIEPDAPGPQPRGDTLALTPVQYEALKERVLSDDIFEATSYTERCYLVFGKGGDDDRAARRDRVTELLDRRRSSLACQLEDFGLGRDEMEAWVPAFEILVYRATHVVGVFEDYDGSYEYELGYLTHYQRTEGNLVWLLRRRYPDPDEHRAHYDGGMPEAHLQWIASAAADRLIEWMDPADLPDAVREIP